MRFRCISTAVAVLLFVGIYATPEQALSSGYYGGVTYYYPAPTVVYYRPYARAYYARPMYYSYSSPCVYYVRPVYCEPSYSYQPSDDRGYSSAPPSTAKSTTTTTVSAYDNRFSPETINVQPGTTVRWVNYGHHAHTVTANDDSWDSGDIQPGASYSATFNRPGTYYYYCRHHTQDRMQGVVVVGSATGSGNGGNRSSGY
jgi:plastocyanin